MTSSFNDETLVSYLDGELPSEDAARIEEGIQADPGLKDRIDSLRMTWDILDDLPLDEPSPDLAQTTIEMVALSVEAEKEAVWKRVFKNRALAIGVLAVVFAGLGAISGRLISGFLDDNFIENLPAVTLSESLESTRIHKWEWIEQLETVENLLIVGDYLINLRKINVAQPISDGLVPVARLERRDWLDQLTNNESTRLRNLFDVWIDDTEGWRRNEMKDIAEQFFTEDKSKTTRLIHVLQAYEAVLDSKGTQFRNTIEAAPLEKKIEMLNDEIATLMGRRYGYQISESDADAIFNWMDEIRFEDYVNFQGGSLQILEEIIDSGSKSITDERISEFVQSLDGTTQQLLSAIDERKHRSIIGEWCYAVVEPEAVPNTMSYEELSAAFDELDYEEASTIEVLPEPAGRDRLAEQMSPTTETVP